MNTIVLYKPSFIIMHPTCVYGSGSCIAYRGLMTLLKKPINNINLVYFSFNLKKRFHNKLIRFLEITAKVHYVLLDTSYRSIVN